MGSCAGRPRCCPMFSPTSKGCGCAEAESCHLPLWLKYGQSLVPSHRPLTRGGAWGPGGGAGERHGGGEHRRGAAGAQRRWPARRPGLPRQWLHLLHAARRPGAGAAPGPRASCARAISAACLSGAAPGAASRADACGLCSRLLPLAVAASRLQGWGVSRAHACVRRKWPRWRGRAASTTSSSSPQVSRAPTVPVALDVPCCVLPLLTAW